MEQVLTYAAMVWAGSGMIADMTARRWARKKKGIDLPGDIIFAMLTGPFSAYLTVRFVREELDRSRP